LIRNNTVSLGMRPHGLIEMYRCFRETRCLHLRGNREFVEFLPQYMVTRLGKRILQIISYLGAVYVKTKKNGRTMAPFGSARYVVNM
jgi:hypothetical protein